MKSPLLPALDRPQMDREAAALPELPAKQAFPAQPATWYLFGRARDVGRQPHSKAMLGRRIVAYRTARGRVVVMDADCAHLGTDLGRGCVVGDTLRCPYHHWQYAPDGRCVSVPDDGPIPSAAKLRTYPVVERHGLIFFFFGSWPRFELPFFSGCEPADFVASKPFRFRTDSPWYMLVGNGFDTQHFQSVHDRKLCGEPAVDCPAPLARRMRFDAEVVGTSIFDRFLKRFVGRHVKISITSWGGPHLLVEGVFAKAHSRLLIASQPLDAANTLSDVIVFARKSKLAWWDKINLSIRRQFTRAFVRYDIDKLSGVRYRPGGLTASDLELARYFQWIATLPCSDYEDINDEAQE